MAFFPFWRCVGQDAFERRRTIAAPPQLSPPTLPSSSRLVRHMARGKASFSE
jgi:hypothetical protein